MASPIRSFTLSFKRRCCSMFQDLRIIFNSFSEPPAGALAGVFVHPSEYQSQSLRASQNGSVSDSIFDGILLAVPKFRRSLEKRLHRKHRFTGFMEYGTPKTNIVPCLECGNFKEKGHLCPHCYERVRAETNDMQARMGDELKFDVPRSEVEFIYENEKPTDGTHIVKMSKPRPSWFPRRLLNKTGS